ncbi:MAG: 3-isopropylmalate dehydrogenase [Acetobacter sp.]|nr:3-isopropylmalate dehydrogenase [Acetobacter sp.]
MRNKKDSFKILILPGDGIGPEVVQQVTRLIEWLEQNRPISFHVTYDLVGGASLAEHGVPIRDEVIKKAWESDAVLFGSVGDPCWAHVGFDKRPEVAILALRHELGLFANLRPAKIFDALTDASTLKPEVIRGLDIMIVRESVGGIYFGDPRGIEVLPDGSKKGINTEIYTTSEIERVARVAFTLARKRCNRVCSVEKSNVMESGLLWKEVVTNIHQQEFPDVTLSHMLADNCAMQLVRNPCQFDVLVTGNLFGDLLSDLASMLTGSLGLLPSATLGETRSDGKCAALYEPIHGSAPDIAGKGIANPIGQILSFAMMLRYSLHREEEALLIESAVSHVLADGFRTADIMSEGMKCVGTAAMGDAIISKLAQLAKV